MKLKQDKILKIYSEKLKYFNYSKNSIKIYTHYTSEFLIFTKKNYQHLTSNDFKFYLDNYNFSSISQQNQIISSIKFLYEKVLNKKYAKIDFSRPRKSQKLPKVIDAELLASKIKTYISYTEMFLSHFKQDVYHISIKDAQHFLENYNYKQQL